MFREKKSIDRRLQTYNFLFFLIIDVRESINYTCMTHVRDLKQYLKIEKLPSISK